MKVAQHEMGHYVLARALGFRAGVKATVIGGAALALAAAALISWAFDWSIFWSGAAVGAVVVALLIYSYRTRIKVIRDFPNKGDVRKHRAAWRFSHYDQFLDKRIRYARHAQAIDESRATFARVGWGRRADMAGAPDDWLVQRWFAGNHSDIGGSYPENESRLSDIALEWMVEQATEIPDPIIIDESKLHMFPDAGGMQHCEVAGLRELYPS